MLLQMSRHAEGGRPPSRSDQTELLGWSEGSLHLEGLTFHACVGNESCGHTLPSQPRHRTTPVTHCSQLSVYLAIPLQHPPHPPSGESPPTSSICNAVE
jgi:hypothetical protein